MSFDNLGNPLNGYLGNATLRPKDNEVLDIYYHIGNTSELIHVKNEKSEIVVKCKKKFIQSMI